MTPYFKPIIEHVNGIVCIEGCACGFVSGSGGG